MIRSTLRLGAFSALACLLYACGMQQASLPPLGDHSVVLWDADTVDFSRAAPLIRSQAPTATTAWTPAASG